MGFADLSPLASKYIRAVSRRIETVEGKRVSVDPVVSELAGFWEKIRSAMEYQEEEVVLRSSIERILRRRLLFDAKGEKIAQPLMRELAWAKYFEDNTFPEVLISTIAQKINLYLSLKAGVRHFHHNKIKKETLDDWILGVLSADIAFTINPREDMQILTNFMFHIFSGKITVIDGKTSKNALVFLNIRRAIAKEDKEFLRFELFYQYFGEISRHNLEQIARNFPAAYNNIEDTFSHPLNEPIFSYIKRQAVPFVILRDVVSLDKPTVDELFVGENLQSAILKVCRRHYREIGRKTRRAIIRSIIFLFVTKALFALLVEGVIERLVYGHVLLTSLSINTLMPPAIMFFVLFLVRTPGRENSLKIVERAKSILFDPKIEAIEEKAFSVSAQNNTFLYASFIGLWLLGFAAGIWFVHLFLNILGIDVISQGVFVFFLVVVSFLAYRINQAAKVYNVASEKEGFATVLFNFFFMPFIHLGRRLTLSFSRLNVFLIVVDFVIETPFKSVFLFMEQWFFFLRGQREKLG